MGNWNRRYVPRKRYNYNQYEDPPSSPPKPYNDQSYSSGIKHNRVPSWEIDYCNSLKVPWNKILASKKYIYSYPTVHHWDGSACKEALESAKQRYWATINNFSCDIPLPDPDVYIDNIDWNPYVDPELMADLDRIYFNPDKAHNELETTNEEVGCAQVHDMNQDTGWGEKHVQITGKLDTVSGWGQWNDSVNLKNENPWEQSCDQHVDSLKNNTWTSGNISWGCNSRNYGSQNVVVKQEGWGCYENNSWGWGHENANGQESRNYSRQNNNSTGLKDRGWGGNGNGPWGQRETEYSSNNPNCWDSKRFTRGGTSFRGDGRKRESSFQHTSKNKSSRYQDDNHRF